MENTLSPSTSAKNELISNIKEWIRLDTEISKKNAELKICKNAKTTLTKTLIQLMKTHNIDCFDINGGALLYKQRKSKQTISKKYLLAQVQEYFKNDVESANELTAQVLNNREEKLVDELKRNKSNK